MSGMYSSSCRDDVACRILFFCFFLSFLDAPPLLCKRVCMFVRLSVRRSGTPSLRRVLGASYAGNPALFFFFLFLFFYLLFFFFSLFFLFTRFLFLSFLNFPELPLLLLFQNDLKLLLSFHFLKPCFLFLLFSLSLFQFPR